jgi:SAM-dependent methyltransferase
MTNDSHYVGQELEIFAHAKNWKGYWSSQIQPFLSGDVLEVGAGIGANTALLKPDRFRSWTCLEPDADLAERAAAAYRMDPATYGCRVVVGTTASLRPGPGFDALLYIDVLEHIEDDRGELQRAASLLRQGGRIIVLSPAHSWLYTPFDRSIGHCRRYNKATLAACTPEGCTLKRLWYLDSVGLLASSGNRLLLQQAMPNLQQILFWDRFLVRPSILLDRLLAHTLGKSILAIWTKD